MVSLFYIWSIYGYLVLLPSDVLLALFLWATCLTFVYFTTTARDGVNTVLDHVEFCWWLDGLVSVFNGISTFVGFLMPKLFS